MADKAAQSFRFASYELTMDGALTPEHVENSKNVNG